MADQADSIAHRTHDLELVAGLAAGDLTGSDARRAAELAASCSDCAEIVGDLRAIMAATRVIPSAFDPGTAPAPRDYRLTPADAARLGRRSWFGLGGTSASRSWMRRAGVGLATFGLVGILVSAIPLGFLGAAGAAPSLAGADQGFSAASTAPQPQGPEATSAPQPRGPVATSAPVKSSGAPERDLATSGSTAPQSEPPVGPVTFVGAVSLIGGLALILASRRGRRVGP